MANHGFVTVKTKLTIPGVDEAIREIASRRYLGKIEVRGPYELEGERAAWTIYYAPSGKLKSFDDQLFAFEIWLHTSRKLEFRHPSGGWPQYGQMMFTEELATKFEGIISDEGVEEKWKPDLTKYPTYESWLCKLTGQGVLSKFLLAWIDETPNGLGKL